MKPAVKPFETLLGRKPRRNRLATTHGVYRILKSIFGRMGVSGKGISLAIKEDARLHLEVDPLDSLYNYPFRCHGSGGVLTIEPGSVITDALIDGTLQKITFTPTGFGGVALDHASRRGNTFRVNNLSGYMVLRINYSAAGGIKDWPRAVWQVLPVVDNGRMNQALQRVNGYNGEGQDAIIDLEIARFQGGAVTHQIVGSTVHVSFRWNDFMASFLPPVITL